MEPYTYVIHKYSNIPIVISVLHSYWLNLHLVLPGKLSCSCYERKVYYLKLSNRLLFGTFLWPKVGRDAQV